MAGWYAQKRSIHSLRDFLYVILPSAASTDSRSAFLQPDSTRRDRPDFIGDPGLRQSPLGSPLAALRYVTTSGLMDDVIFARKL